MQCKHTKEVYSVVNNNETMTFEEKWIELEMIMLRKTRQTLKNK